MQKHRNRRNHRTNVCMLGAFLAVLPLELYVSGALIGVVVFIDFMFDPARMLKNQAREHVLPTL